MSRKLYRLMIEIFWWVEHRQPSSLAAWGYINRKKWEHKYVVKFNENIYGQPL